MLSQVKQRIQNERFLDVLETIHARLCALEERLRNVTVDTTVDLEEIRKLQKEHGNLADRVRSLLPNRKP